MLTGIMFQMFFPLFEKVFNRFFVFAILDLRMMSPDEDRKEYVCEETLTNKSNMYIC